MCVRKKSWETEKLRFTREQASEKSLSVEASIHVFLNSGKNLLNWRLFLTGFEEDDVPRFSAEKNKLKWKKLPIF